MKEVNKEIEEMAEVVIKQIPYDENKLTQDNEYAINLSLAIATALRKVNYQKISGNTSDGYHTFNELYHHRAILFAMVCNQNSDKAWKSKLHSDGTMFDNMFIVGIDTPQGQATYHYDINPYWEYFKVKELPSAPLYDGHTPNQAIDRILDMAMNIHYQKNEVVSVYKHYMKSGRTEEEVRAEAVKEFAEKINVEANKPNIGETEEEWDNNEAFKDGLRHAIELSAQFGVKEG